MALWREQCAREASRRAVGQPEKFRVPPSDFVLEFSRTCQKVVARAEDLIAKATEQRSIFVVEGQEAEEFKTIGGGSCSAKATIRPSCTFGVLGLSCVTTGASGPLGFHTTAREHKRARLRVERNFGWSGGGGLDGAPKGG